MLKLVWLSEQACKQSIWTKFDPARQTWIISDRKTKFFFQKSLLAQNGIISEPVKRVREFWRELLKTAAPEMRLLEDLGARVQARDFLLREGKSEWCARPRAPQKLLEACRTFASLLTHDLVDEYMMDFRREFNTRGDPFLEIVELGTAFFRESVEKGRLPQFWCPYFLSQVPKILLSEHELIFDLGFEMTEGDKELIQLLSKTNDVSVLVPAANVESLEAAGLYAYRNFGLGVAKFKEEKTADNYQTQFALKTPQPRMELWRCSSPEAEARKAVEQIARWVKRGVKPTDIVVTAENLSNYEDVLRHDLDWEGIGFYRKIQTVISASRLFRALNARLLIVTGALRSTILEEAFLSVAPYKGTLRRRNERRVLKPIIQEQQVPLPELRQHILKLRKLHKPKMNVVEFEDLAIQLFKRLIDEVSGYEEPHEADQRNELFLRAIGKLRGEIGDQELELNHWIEAWQEVTRSLKLPIKAPVEGGVWGVDLSAAEDVPAAHLIVLGAVEGGQRRSTALSPDKLNYLKEKGFDFEGPSKKKTDPYLLWLISSGRDRVALSCPKTDSAGKSVAASALWLKFASKMKKDLDELDYTLHTRWIDAQKLIAEPHVAHEVDIFKKWTAGTTLKLATLVNEEIKGERKVELGVQNAQPMAMSLSASRLESYWECPYRFYARAHLGLFDEQDLEVEPSPQKRGQWLHAAVEAILNSPMKLSEWDDDKLKDLIENLDDVEIQKQVSSDIWPSIQQRFLRQLKRFVQYEIDWQKKYPLAKPFKLEAEIRGAIHWSQSEPTIWFTKPQRATESQTENGTEAETATGTETGAGAGARAENWAPYSGSIDRIDTTALENAIIIDYKSGGAAASNISSWLKNGKFQLALYSEAFAAGLHDGILRKVIAAQYYSLKKLEREKGFKVTEEDLVGILPLEKSTAGVSHSEKDKALAEIRQGVQEILEKIRSGDMTPTPHSEKICSTCSWRTQCRAPHLS